MDRADVIIFGGGLVGLALASALDSSGLSAIVVDPADPASRTTAAFDGRTSAVSSSSMRMLQAIGVADHLAEAGCPILTITVADGLQPGGLHFEAEQGEPLGWMHENRHLRVALQARAEAGPNTWLLWKSQIAHVDRGDHGVVVALEDGRKLFAPLLIAADGRNSPMREAAGIRMARWKYDHHAIVSVLRHEGAHENVAYEIFYPSGPFALLPMTDDASGHRSAIVWSVPEADAAGWLSLSDEDFAAEAQAAMGDFLGKIEMLAPRSSYRSPPNASRWSAIRPMRSIRSLDRASTSAFATLPRSLKSSLKARGSGSTSAIGSRSIATSGGVRSIRFLLRWRRTASPASTQCRARPLRQSAASGWA